MAIIEIPIDIANKKIKQQVTLDNVVYGLEFKYNKRYTAWTMNILDDQNNMIVSGIILYTNTSLLTNYYHLAVPKGMLFIIDSDGTQTTADETNLGITHKLLYREP